MPRRNLELNLGRRCNNRCVFCLDATAPAQARRWLPLERAVGELRRARGEGATSVGLLGGEPTAHPEILTIVGAARDLGFTRVALASNGLRLGDDAAVAEALVDAGVTRFSLSIHGHTEAIEDTLSGRHGNLRRKLGAVRALVALRDAGRLPDNVSLNPVLCRPNAPHLVPFMAWWRRAGIDDVRFNLIRTDTCPDRGEQLTPRLDQVRTAILQAVAANRARLKMSLSFGDVPLCAYPWEVLRNERLAAATVGEARDLDTWVAIWRAPGDPDAEAQRFRWTDRKRDELKLQPSQPCSGCAVARACEGVWRSYVELFGAAELRAFAKESLI